MVQTTDLIPGGGGPEPASAGARLIAAAGPLFAEQGYDPVSTRALARAAGVNLSAITYHFGGKEGLYRAVIQNLIDELAPHRRAVIALLDAGLAEAKGDRQALARLAAQLVARVVGILLGGSMPRWRFTLMLREIGQPSEHFALLMNGHIAPLQEAVGGLVAAATGARADDEATKLLTQSVVGQCLLFGIAKTVVLSRLGWPDYTPDKIERVIATVTRSVLGSLGLPPPSQGGGR